MTTLSEVNEYLDRLNKRLITFGESQKQIEQRRAEAFGDVADKEHDLFKGRELGADNLVKIDE